LFSGKKKMCELLQAMVIPEYWELAALFTILFWKTVPFSIQWLTPRMVFSNRVIFCFGLILTVGDGNAQSR